MNKLTWIIPPDLPASTSPQVNKPHTLELPRLHKQSWWWEVRWIDSKVRKRKYIEKILWYLKTDKKERSGKNNIPVFFGMCYQRGAGWLPLHGEVQEAEVYTQSNGGHVRSEAIGDQSIPDWPISSDSGIRAGWLPGHVISVVWYCFPVNRETRDTSQMEPNSLCRTLLLTRTHKFKVCELFELW